LLWREDVELPRCFAKDGPTPSLIFDPWHQKLLRSLSVGDPDISIESGGAEEEAGLLSSDSDSGAEFKHSGTTPLKMGANALDIPFMKAVLASGANVDFDPRSQGASGEHAYPVIMGVICRIMMTRVNAQEITSSSSSSSRRKGGGGSSGGRGEEEGGRSDIAVLDFLLSVGAKPWCDPVRYPPPLPFPPNTPLGCVAMGMPRGSHDVVSDAFTAGLLVKLLTAPTPIPEHALAEAAATIPMPPLRRGFQRFVKQVLRDLDSSVRVRQPAQCVCGSGRLPVQCHGGGQGIPLNPKDTCPCKYNQARPHGTWRSYKNCCLKRNVVYRAKLYGDEGPGYYPCRELRFEAVDDNSVELQQHYVSSMHAKLTAQGLTEEEIDKQKVYSEENIRAYEALRRSKLERILRPLMLAGKVDPAFGMCVLTCDFWYPRPWRDKGEFGKAEMLVREKEWNGAVDAYIEAQCREERVAKGLPVDDDDLRPPRQQRVGPGRHRGLDLRPRAAIEKAAKINWAGGPLYARCGNWPACGSVERSPASFKCCGRCKAARYCSPACAKAAWKLRHRGECGGEAGEPRLPSEVALTEVLNEETRRTSELELAAIKRGDVVAKGFLAELHAEDERAAAARGHWTSTERLESEEGFPLFFRSVSGAGEGSKELHP
jgi:hypothetical protein